jgi:hypothetical protein
VHDFSWRDGLVADAANVTSEKQPEGLTRRLERYFTHA